MTPPVGPPIGTLFSAASVPFNVKSIASYQIKPLQLLKKRKRTISKTSVKDVVSSVDNTKRLKQEEDRTNSDIEETVTQCSASDDVGMLAEQHNISNETLNVSEFYATAAESFGNGDSVVFISPQKNASKSSPPIWRKRKRYSIDDDMFFISRKKLKANSNEIINKSKLQNNKKGRKGL